MSDPISNVYAKFVGAVGDNPVVNQLIVTGGNLLHAARGFFRRAFAPHDEIELMQQRNEYLRRQVEISQSKLELQQRKHAFEEARYYHDIAADVERLENERTALNLRSEANSIAQEEAEVKKDFYNSFLQILNYNHQSLLQMKAYEIQAEWDLHNLPFYFSREETLKLFQSSPGLLILLSPSNTSGSNEGFRNSLSKEIEYAINNSISTYYSMESGVFPIECHNIFKRPIANAEAAYTRNLIARPSLILSSTITEEEIYITLTCPLDITSEKHNFRDRQYEYKWNWDEIFNRLLNEGKNKVFAHRVIRDVIVVMHITLSMYFCDLYYLSFDPYYEPKLLSFINTLPANLKFWLQPYADSLLQIRNERQLNSLNNYAQEMFDTQNYFYAAKAYIEMARMIPNNPVYSYRIGDSIYNMGIVNVYGDAGIEVDYDNAFNSYLEAWKMESYIIGLHNYEHIYRCAEIAYRFSIEKADWYNYAETAIYLYDTILDFLQLHPDQIDFAFQNDIYTKRGLMLLRRGEYKRSLDSFNEAIQHNDNNFTALIGKSIAARNFGNLMTSALALISYGRRKKKFLNDEIYIGEIKILFGEISYFAKESLIQFGQIINRRLDKMNTHKILDNFSNIVERVKKRPEDN